jgi:uncharacterized protein (DUF433 family)
MKPKDTPTRIELGRHIVADPKTCGGQPTFTGSRIMVWIVLDQLDRGMTWDEIVGEWRGKVSKAAIAEAIAIAPLVEKNKPFNGFHVGARRKLARRPMRAICRSVSPAPLWLEERIREALVERAEPVTVAQFKKNMKAIADGR